MQNQGTHVWDDTLKRLVEAYPQDFVSWLLTGATFTGFRATELRNKKLIADVIADVELAGEPMLLGIEFQSTDDSEMAERLLEYSILASRMHERMMLSCVIYLRENKNTPVSPLIWQLPNGQSILEFHFVVLKLWEIEAEAILQSGLVGLLPLLPLTKNGKRQEVVEEMINTLVSARNSELLSLSQVLAGLVLKSDVDQEWLKRRFAMHEDILKESWVYQELVQKGRDEARQEAEQERLRLQQDVLLNLIRVHFPAIAAQATKLVQHITNQVLLMDLIVQVTVKHTEHEVIQLLTEASKQKNS